MSYPPLHRATIRASPQAADKRAVDLCGDGHLPMFCGDPLVNIQNAIENGHRNSGFSIKNMVISIVFCMFTRG